MLTDAEKRELDALKAKSDLTDDEKSRLAALEAKAGGGDGDTTFSKEYVEALRKENARYRTSAKEANEKLAQFDGVDPAKYHEYQTAAEKAEQERLKKEGDWNKLREKLIEQHNAELAKKDQVIADLQKKLATAESDLGKTIRSHEVGVEAAAAEAINSKLVEMVVEQQTRIETSEDGKRTIVVLDTDGQPAIDPKTGKPKTVAALLQDMKTSNEYAHLFKGGKVGAGSGTENFGDKSAKNPWKADSLNLTLQGKLIRENRDTARRLIVEAGKDPNTYGL